MTATPLPPLIEQMLDPAFYDHGVTAPIRLVQTHVSYVLLTGDYAYKVKKPVNFGFLDYSTLAQRAHFCQEELRLNQRTAAALYLGVRAIVQRGDRYGFQDHPSPGEAPVDYAVQMRQFPESSLLSQRFAQGALTAERVRDLAGAIAQFHQQAETNPEIQSYGTVAQIRQAFDENYAQTLAYVGGPQTQAQLEATQAATDHFFAQRADLLAQRMAGGYIRACHGDLHLNNICDWQGQIYLFDCIEFNKPFRFVDVMYDVAYLVMDFTKGGREDLAGIFLSEYAEQTGDWAGLEVLPLYVSRQSYVRAKVTSFLLGDTGIPEAEQAAAATQAAQYYTLAHQALQPRPGRLFLMAGLSGAGKSTIARALTAKIGAIHLRSDAVRKHLAGVPLTARGGDDLYTPAMTAQTYDRLLALGLTLTQAGYSVILDAKYDRQELRQGAIAQAQAAAIPLKILHCTAPPAVLAQRVAERTGDIADATVAILAQQSFEPFTPEELPWVQVLDTTQALELEGLL